MPLHAFCQVVLSCTAIGGFGESSKPLSSHYHSFGAAAAEVEVDCITGETLGDWLTHGF